jgi:hypothetical protein
MIKNKRVKKNWTTEDLLILIWVVGKYIHSKNIKDPYYGLVCIFLHLLEIRRLGTHCRDDPCMHRGELYVQVAITQKDKCRVEESRRRYPHTPD